MEGMQATDGSRYFNGALHGVVKQAAGEDSLEDRLRLKRAGARAARRVSHEQVKRSLTGRNKVYKSQAGILSPLDGTVWTGRAQFLQLPLDHREEASCQRLPFQKLDHERFPMRTLKLDLPIRDQKRKLSLGPGRSST
jgi:hypothetical protein